MPKPIATISLVICCSLCFAQTSELVRINNLVTSGADLPSFKRNITHFTYDLLGSTGTSDWTGSEIEVDVLGTGTIWHASDQRLSITSPPADPNELCYVHNLQTPSLQFNPSNNVNTRMYDTFFTAPGARFTVDPQFAAPGLPSPNPAECPAMSPIVSTPTRIRGISTEGLEIPLAWFDINNAPLNNTTLARFTFVVPPEAPIVGLEDGPNRFLFAIIRGRITSNTNIPGTPFEFHLYQVADCNTNGILDADDIAGGTSADCNENGIPDECEATLLPSITTHPANVFQCQAGDAVFSVAATGDGLSYQWRRNGVDLADGPSIGGGTISGSNATTLTIANAGVVDSGEYAVRVYNGCGEVVSFDAVLSVFDPMPLLFVTNSANSAGIGPSVAALNPGDGSLLRTIVPTGSLAFPNGMAADSAGNFYVVDSAGNVIVKYDWQTGAELARYHPSPAANFIDPVSVGIYENGAERWLYVTGYTTNNVVRFNLDNPAQSTVFSNLGSFGIVTPGALLVRPDGRLLVAAEESDIVVELTSAGTVARVAASGCGLDLPSGLLIDPFGNLLVSSLRTNSIVRYSSAGACMGTLVAGGSGGLSQPYGMRVTATGELQVASRLTNQILSYNVNTGTFLGVFASGLDRPRYFASPTVCGSDCNGNERADVWDIGLGGSTDCNGNNLPDECEFDLEPRIVVDPMPTDVCTGGTAHLSVVFTSDPTATIEWRRGATVLTNGPTGTGSVISGADTAVLEIANAGAADTGGYSVEVTNSCGSDTSAETLLSVQPPIQISTQPSNRDVCTGSAVALSVVASGPGTITYQWYHDDAVIVGATAPILNIPFAMASDAGTYYVRVANSCGPVQSDSVSIAVLASPVILAPPTDQSACAGRPAVMSVTPEGLPSEFTYQWRLDDSPIPGATAQLLLIEAATPSDAGEYAVEIRRTSTGCTTISAAATLTVTRLPGDVNFDAEVDLADLATLLSNFGIETGATWEGGDFDEDGDVDLTDLATLLGVFGTDC